jgi:sugar/nucleoside kinase (ribokinase family)
MDHHNPPALTVIGDVGVDVVLGPIDRWPAIGTESLMDHSELRPGGSAGNAALAASYLGVPCRLLSLVGNDSLGRWLAEQFHSLNPALRCASSRRPFPSGSFTRVASARS